jgi:hypothetical protein
MRCASVSLAVGILAMAGLSCSLLGSQAPPASAATAIPVDAPTAADPAVSPTPVVGPSTQTLYTCYGCGGDQVWVLGEGEPHPLR